MWPNLLGCTWAYLDLGVDGCVLIILRSVRRGVDVDAVVTDVLTDPHFEGISLLQGEGVRLADHRDNVDAVMESLHELHVDGPQAIQHKEG